MTPASLLFVVVVVTQLTMTSNAGRVVFVPNPFTSHVKYHTGVARAVAKLGHQVWVTIPSYLLARGHLDISGFSVVSYETIPDLEEKALNKLPAKYLLGEKEDLFGFLQLCADLADWALRNDSFVSTIRDIRPDLIVIDNVVTFFVMAVLPYKLGVPFGFMGTSYYPRLQRIPFSPADVPIPILPYSNRMTFFQRVVNTLTHLLFEVYQPSFLTKAVAIYAPEMPYVSLQDLVARAEVWLVESDYVLDYPKPLLPNVKLIGGTAAGPAQPLPADWQAFMDSASEGVVIVTFGSYVLGIPQVISDTIMNVLLQLPMKSVMRSNLTSSNPDKIRTASWIPQNDLLGHSNTQLFVSHCGKNGQYEALYHGVPVVAMPIFADQIYNAERARVKGFAEVLDLRTCTEEELFSTMMKVAQDHSYKEAASKLSRLFRELHGVPMNTAAFWLDHVMEHGGDYMRSAGQEMPLYQYLLLDVILFILLVVTLVTGLMYFFLRAVWKCLCRRKAKTE